MPPLKPREELGINLFDLDRIDPSVRQGLLAGVLDLSNGIRYADDPPDEVLVRFTCPIRRAACLADIIRSGDRKAGRAPARTYVRRGEGWVKVSPQQALLVNVDGVGILNPAVFASAPTIQTPLPSPKKVSF